MFGFTPRSLVGHFTVLGFRTRIRPGFWLFIALIVALYPFPLGIWIAGAVALFTLIHELGHALAARHAGCTAQIALDFMVAYAAYESPRELSWQRRAFIALAGPALQITLATAVLVATGTNPLVRDSITHSNFSVAVWWAGCALGFLNLIPLVPLDGGAIVSSVIDGIWPKQGRAIMLKISFVITTILLVASLLSPAKPLLPFLGLLLFIQWQEVQQPRRLARMMATAEIGPTGDQSQDSAIATILFESGQAIAVTKFATQAYQQCPSFRLAIIAARASVAVGDLATSVQWLHAAVQSQFEKESVQHAVQDYPELSVLQSRDDVSAEWFTKR